LQLTINWPKIMLVIRQPFYEATWS